MRATLVTAALATAVLTPPPARAQLLGHATVNVARVPGGFSVCFHGSIDPAMSVTGAWKFQMHGVRGTNPYSFELPHATDPVVDDCHTLSKDSTARGIVLATLTYAGIGADVSAGAVGGAAWDPVVWPADFVFGTST